MLHIAQNLKTTNTGLGYTLSDLVRLPPSPTRKALTAFLLCARHGVSLRDAADLEDVSLTYVAAISRCSPEQRAQLITGDLTLSEIVNGRSRKHNGCPDLAELLAAASSDERAAAPQAIGVAVVWDQMIKPLIDEKRSTPAPECIITTESLFKAVR